MNKDYFYPIEHYNSLNIVYLCSSKITKVNFI